MADIFFGTEVEPSAFEIAMQNIFLSGLTQRVAETNDLSSAVNEALGFRRDAEGSLVELTDEERVESLDPTQRSLFNRLEEQNERLERAFAGDLPVSERLKLRSEEQFNVLQEEQARRGNLVTGDNLDTAVGFSTPAIQSIGERQRTQGLLEDEERRGEIDRGFSNIFQGTGLLSDLRGRDLTNRIGAPSRFDVGGGGGLLSSAGANSLFNAQSQADALSGAGGLLGSLLDPTITSTAGAIRNLIF